MGGRCGGCENLVSAVAHAGNMEVGLNAERTRDPNLYNRDIVYTQHKAHKSLISLDIGAGEGNRTLDTQLGKLMFCH